MPSNCYCGISRYQSSSQKTSRTTSKTAAEAAKFYQLTILSLYRVPKLTFVFQWQAKQRSFIQFIFWSAGYLFLFLSHSSTGNFCLTYSEMHIQSSHLLTFFLVLYTQQKIYVVRKKRSRATSSLSLFYHYHHQAM